MLLPTLRCFSETVTSPIKASLLIYTIAEFHVFYPAHATENVVETKNKSEIQ